jgi:hypothetical protein
VWRRQRHSWREAPLLISFIRDTVLRTPDGLHNVDRLVVSATRKTDCLLARRHPSMRSTANHGPSLCFSLATPAFSRVSDPDRILPFFGQRLAFLRGRKRIPSLASGNSLLHGLLHAPGHAGVSMGAKGHGWPGPRQMQNKDLSTVGFWPISGMEPKPQTLAVLRQRMTLQHTPVSLLGYLACCRQPST